MMAFSTRPPVLEYTSFDNPSPEEEAQPSLLSRLFGRRKKYSIPGPPNSDIDVAASPERRFIPSERDTSPGSNTSRSDDRFSTALHSPVFSDDSFVTRSTDERREMVGLMRWLTRVLYVRDPSRSKEYRRYWMADRDCSECYECGDRFSTFRRRHHCRICGHIFCGRCSSQAVPGSCVGLPSATVRACFHCARMYHRYARVQQGLPEGATDEWIVSEASVATPPSELPLSPDLPPSGQGGEADEEMETQSPLPVPSVMRDDKILSSRRGSYGSLPDSSSERQSSDTEGLIRKGSLPNLTIPLPFDRQCRDGEVQLTREALRQERVLVKDNMQLLRIWVAMVHPDYGDLKRHNFRHKLSYFTDCVLGCDLVDWLISHNKVNSRTQGQVMCQAFLDLRLMRPLQSRENVFRDSYIMYHLREMHPDDYSRILASEEDFFGESDCEPQWLRDIGSSVHDDESGSQEENFGRETVQGRSTFYMDVERGPHIARMESDPGDSILAASNTDLRRNRADDMLDIQLEEDENEEEEKDQTFIQLTDAHMRHVRALVEQEIRIRYLDMSWASTVCDLAIEVASSVRPDVKHDGDHMDIRPYVKIKKISGGRPEDSEIVYGLVCTKNLTHRGAARHIKIPSLLLIESAIDLHERKEGKEFVSMDTQIRQEAEALKHCVARIVDLKPSLVVTQRTVALRAQELLHDAGVALVTNMKEANMLRLHRCTHATIVESVESLLPQTNCRLGTCFKFRVKSYTRDPTPPSHSTVSVGNKNGLSAFNNGSKTLMFFEECGKHLGCTVVLRGGSLSQLARVKEVLHFAVYAFYNARLEMRYFHDCGVRIPPPSDAPEEAEMPNSFLRMMERSILTVSSQVEVLPPYLATVRNDVCRLRRQYAHLLDYPSVRIINHALKRLLSLARAEIYEQRHVQPVVNVRLAKRQPVGFLTRGLDSQSALKPNSNLELGFFRRNGGMVHYKEGKHPLLVREAWSINRPATKTERQEEVREEKRKASFQWSVFDVRNHQKIAILFSCFLIDSALVAEGGSGPVSCVHPWTIIMHFYGRHDLTLGHFLEGYCFRENYRCPNIECTQPMLNHRRRFVHGDGQLSVSLKKMPKDIAVDGINTWTWCFTCRTAGKRSHLSPDAWHLSFAKFLQLHFHMPNVISSRTGCQHPFHEQQQYFCYRSIIATFKYERIKLYEVNLPPNEGNIVPPTTLSEQLMMEVNKLVSTSTQIIATIFEYVHHLTGRQQNDNMSSLLQIFSGDIEDHRNKLQLMTQPLLVCVASDVFRHPQDLEEDVDQSPPRRLNVLVQIDEQMTEVRLWIAQTIQHWNMKIGEYLSRERRLARDIARVKRPSRSSDSLEQLSSTTQPVTLSSSPHRHITVPGSPSPLSVSPGASHDSQDLVWSNGTPTAAGESGGNDSSPAVDLAVPPVVERSTDDLDTESNNSFVMCSAPSGEACPATQEKGRSVDAVDGKSRSTENENSTRMSDKLGVRKMFSKLFPSTDRDKFEIQLSPHEHPQLPPCCVTPVLVCDEQPSSIIAYALSSIDYRTQLEELKEGMASDAAGNAGGGSNEDGEYLDFVIIMEDADERLEESGEVLNQNRALLLKIPGNRRGREEAAKKRGRDTAFTFRNSKNPEEKKRVDPVVKYTPGRDSSCDNLPSSPSPAVEASIAESETPRIATEPSVPPPSRLNEKHINIQMNTHSAQFYCKIFFAREFEALRQSIFPQGEKVFIRSLSKCASWSGEGGKSGSTFLKTLDDRFVLKQMSQPEIMSFQEFAPSYFQYMAHLVKSQEPSVLAKIFGVFYIGWRTPITGEKMYVLVMENLIYQRQVRQLFDLKGSRRNRLFTPKAGAVPGQNPAFEMNRDASADAASVGGHSSSSHTNGDSSHSPTSHVMNIPVLLDENFIKQSLETPFYLRWHSKTSLRRAIERDTNLLSQNFIMDYSLLVGVDETKKELVFGIIDYMRTFTWDKRIEYIFKSTVGAGTAQGPSRMPTIVSPEVYRTRFLQAMDHYFLESPDQWHDLLEKNVD